jgi:2-polyprenylphenol 6-hydroxylase
MNKHIIIVGAGVAGLTLAALLATYSDYRISVIEAASVDIRLPDEGVAPRVSALNRYSQSVFQALGIWQELRVRAGVFDHITVWEQAGVAIDFEHADGVLVENDYVRQLLLRQLPSHVTVLAETAVDHIDQDSHQVRVHLASKEIVQADLLVAADGAHSFVRDQVGFVCAEKPYGHDALVCHVTTERAHNKVARQWFLPQGPLAFLPLADAHQCSIVWSNHTDDAQRLMSLDDQAFRQALGQACHQEVGDIEQCTPRFCFPLTMRHATRYVHEHVVLVGDAAHTIHPLAGQGMNLGIQDVTTLADRLISESLSPGCLRRFERERRAYNWRMLVAMQTFKTVFGLSAPSIQSALSAAASIVQKAPPFKQWLMKMAAGPVDELPAWLKGRDKTSL